MPGRGGPDQHAPPTARVAKPRNRVAAIALILGLLAAAAAALGSALMVASHAYTSECIIDAPLYEAGTRWPMIGGPLSLGAAVTGLISVMGRGRARGAYLVMGGAALVVAVVVCLVMLGEPLAPDGAIPPQYLHPC
jgi:hypothetical protein